MIERMNYDTSYACRYHKDDIFLEEDNATDGEKEYVRTILYREDLQHIFQLEEQDDLEVFNALLPPLYDRLKPCNELCDAMRAASSSHLFCEDEEVGLCILLSYDYLYLTHECISSYLEQGAVDKKVFETLLLKIKS